MVGTGQTKDRVRRFVDDAVVGASVALMAWPWLGIDRPLPATAGPTVLAVAVPLLTVLGAILTAGVLVRCWPPLQHWLVAAAVAVAAVLPATSDSATVRWPLVGIAAVLALRQFLGARTQHGLLRDLTRQRAMLAREVFRDPLTGLGNRALFRQHATEALADADDTATAVLLFDLDGFKAVNDTWGHATGDELLRTAAERLRANVRTNDTLARLGGDEFVVLLPRLTDDGLAQTVADRILRDLAEPLVVADTVLTIKASAGIGLARGTDTTLDHVLRQADIALYQAKADGRGIARQFDPRLHAAAEQRRRDEAELRSALAERQFEVHYQPIVDLAGEQTVGVEALVRWHHPTRGVLPPADFLDLAESLGMLPELGGRVLLEACRQGAAWQSAAPGLEINVNLSASQLTNPHLVDEVRQALHSTGLTPGLLVLELTESVALTDLVESARVLGDLKRLGIRIALDDFGTGFSSLSHLGALPVDVVKIDRSFVQAMAESTGATVAEAVLQIARTFDLSPVAEGVEDAEQASRLRDLHCGQAQGYHFAKPMPAAELTALLVDQAGATLPG